MGRLLGHTATFFRHRVVVWLRDGERIEGRFLDRTKTAIIIEVGGIEVRIQKHDLRKMAPVGIAASAETERGKGGQRA